MEQGFYIEKNAAGRYEYGWLHQPWFVAAGIFWMDGWTLMRSGEVQRRPVGQADSFEAAQAALDAQQ